MALTPMAVKDGGLVSRNMDAYQDASSNYIPIVSFDGTRNLYRAAATFTPYATGAVTLLSLTGSATKTVRVSRIAVSGHSTAAGAFWYQLIRGSALGTGGTAVTPTIAKMDTGFGAATAVAKHYTTAAQSAGTTAEGPLAAGDIGTSIITLPTTGPVGLVNIFPEFYSPAGSCIVLRGTSEILELQNTNAGNLAAGTVLSYIIEWVEDAS